MDGQAHLPAVPADAGLTAPHQATSSDAPPLYIPPSAAASESLTSQPPSHLLNGDRPHALDPESTPAPLAIATEAVPSTEPPSDNVKPVEHTAPGISGLADLLATGSNAAATASSPNNGIEADLDMPDVPSSDAPTADPPATEPSVPDAPMTGAPITNGSAAAELPIAPAPQSQPAQSLPGTAQLPPVLAESSSGLSAPVAAIPLTTDTLSQADAQMSDSVPSLTRPRDEDDGPDEPSAKRARFDEADAAPSVETLVAQPADTFASTEPAIASTEPPSAAAVTPTNGYATPPAVQPPAAASVPSDAPASVQVPIASTEAPSAAPAAPATPINGDAPQPAVAPLAAASAPAGTNGTAESKLPSRPTYSHEPLTKVQKKALEEKMKNTKKVKSAKLFLHPVDPVALNIPHYTNIIVSPMDLGTMENKLKNDQYASLEAFVNDFELMVMNCFTFNGPAHAVSVLAQNLRAYFLKQMESVPTGSDAMAAPRQLKKESPAAKPQPRRESRASIGPATMKSPVAPSETFSLTPGGVPQIRRDSNAGRPKRAVIPPASRDLPYSGVKPKRKENQMGLKFCDHILDELRKPRYDKMTVYFAEPVDPVALNIPHYFSIIKKPMDISTMTNKLKTGQYSSADEFKEDFEQMITNCKTFNPPDNGVYIAGVTFKAEVDALWKTKGEWIKKNQPRSQRVSPASDNDSSDEESSEDEVDNGDDEKEATIRALKEQLANMQNMLGQISGVKRESPKASGKKKSRTSGGGAKSKKSGGSAPPGKGSSKSKQSKKQRLVTYEEKQEISSGTENMTAEQAERLTAIITENVAKYKNLQSDDAELEIDDLPNDVQHKLLKYVRTIFPRAQDDGGEDLGLDDEYEPKDRNGKSATGKRKHKPMKKAEQESAIAALSAKVEAMKGGNAGGNAAKAQAESSGDEDSESSEEE